MRFLKIAAVILATLSGSLVLSGTASATPLSTGALALAQTADNPLVSKTQWWGPRWRYRRWGYYRPWRPYWGYRPVYGWYGPRFVCRWRPTPWGPRRVCWRRW